MARRTAQLVATLAACGVLSTITMPAAQASSQRAAVKHESREAPAKRRAPQPRTRSRKPGGPAPLPCGDVLSFEVLLDRQGFSPGQINGTITPNFTRALKAMQAARRAPTTGQPDCDTWRALGGETAEPTMVAYTVTDQDVSGPFEKTIPRELAEQATLASLGYRSALEKLAERFHASPALLQRINKGTAISAGREIKVPAVRPFDPEAKPAPDPDARDITLLVSRDESALRVTRADGTVVFFAPVSSGSGHDPLPAGDWKVTGVSWHPVFNYNPKLFWDAKPRDEKATIKAGPNNPVGVVWIDLNLEHYGLHGTPEPGHVGSTESHGCVRLTNWDAARVAALVKPGTPVQFR